MTDDGLSRLAHLVVGTSIVVAFSHTLASPPNVGWVVTAAGIGFLLVTVTGIAFPDATVLGEPLEPTAPPRRVSVAMLALGTATILLAVVAP
jgi:hypothetical protein